MGTTTEPRHDPVTDAVLPAAEAETKRLAALYALQVLDTCPQAELDALVHAASLVCDTPISLISLVDAERQWFKANLGLPGASQTPRDIAFCAHTIRSDDLFEVPDAQLDPRFAENPLVTGQPDIRFYAGAPLLLADGSRIGSLCVIDRRPRVLTDAQREVLTSLAQVASHILETRCATQVAQEALRDLAASEAWFRALSDGSPHGVFYANVQGACTYSNSQWQQIFGLTAEQSLGYGWTKGMALPDRTALFEAWKNVTSERTEICMEFPVTRPDGSIRRVRARARAVVGPENGLIGCIGSVEDITLSQLAEQALRKSEMLLDRTGRIAGVGGWEVDLQTSQVFWSDETCRIHGLPPGYRPTLEQAINFYAPEARPVIQQAVERGIAQGESWDLELQLLRADNRPLWVRAVGSVEFSDGQAVRLVGAFQDITERRRLLTDLAGQHELLRVTLQSIGDAVITTDVHGRVVWLNPVAERLTGWSTAEGKEKPLTDVFRIVNEQTRQPTENPVELCLLQDKVVGLANHTVLISRHGEEYGIEDSAAPIRNEKGQLLGTVLVFHDVTEQRRMLGEMRYRASHDQLTGLVNRSEFEACMRRTLHLAHENRSEHALLYIDLDQFKLVNDACGHSVGDILLQQVSKLLANTVRSRDILARLGGDEFAVILEHCTADRARRVAQQICERMDDFRFTHEGRHFRIGASIGLVPMDNRWATTSAILQAADTSCYAAKEAGRNRVHAWFDTDLAMRARQGEMQWTTRIELALDEDRFTLFAQRIQPLRGDASGIHAEVLLRMLEADGSMILPGAFLPAAERFHLASRIDRWVLRHVLAWMQSTASLDGIRTISVNLSGQSVGDREFHRWAIKLLGEAGSTICSKLCFEITETAAVTNMADAGVFIEQAHTVGVRVALDDFGAGASSFGYLKTVRVDYLKIDGQFIRDVVTDPLDEAAVRCFADVARVIGVKAVAKFVDQPAVLERLRVIGIDFAQGYLIHKPEHIDALLDAKFNSIPLATHEGGGRDGPNSAD